MREFLDSILFCFPNCITKSFKSGCLLYLWSSYLQNTGSRSIIKGKQHWAFSIFRWVNSRYHKQRVFPKKLSKVEIFCHSAYYLLSLLLSQTRLFISHSLSGRGERDFPRRLYLLLPLMTGQLTYYQIQQTYLFTQLRHKPIREIVRIELTTAK